MKMSGTKYRKGQGALAGARGLALASALAFVVLASAAAAEQGGAPIPASRLPGGLDIAAIDTRADPCTDFYQYACGNWIKDNPVPSDQVRWVRSLSLLEERNLAELRDELTRAAARPASPLQKQYGDFYAACMDVDALESRGLVPLKPTLERISALKDARGIPALIAGLAARGEASPLFGLEVDPDPRDPDQPILNLAQAGLTLPDRQDYGGGTSPYVLKRYRGHLVRMFMLSGDTLEQAGQEAAAVLAIEKALARASASDAEGADPDRRYHLLSMSDLDKLAPDADFRGYFGQLSTLPIDTLNVINPGFVKTVNSLLVAAPIASWRSYFRWHLLSGQASALPSAFRDEQFAFWGANLGRQEAPAPRWKQCAAITERTFADAFAQTWVMRNDSRSTRSLAESLVASLQRALAEELGGLPWMSEETRSAAVKKLTAIQNRIGHPRNWRDYAGLAVDRHDFLGNLQRDMVFERRYLLEKLSRPLDPDEWDLTPTRPQARYDRSSNSLTIPAGLIQPPFFDGAADPAVNFGGLGVLAAHELTHGFDGLGSKFDEHGRLRDWQTPDDRQKFADATRCEVAQYMNFMPKSDDPQDPPLLKAKGNLAVAESTADHGGLRIAFRALMEALLAQGKSADDRLEGYTARQRFFLSFAQISCENQTFLSARQSMAADPHSVGSVRVNGAVQNFEEFGRAFQCARGRPMQSETSCRVW